jgi:hypothetical protein
MAADDTRGYHSPQPPVRPLREPSRPGELSDIEQMLYPRWLDYDPTTGGPSYLGYLMLLLMVALPVLLLSLAIIVALA